MFAKTGSFDALGVKKHVLKRNNFDLIVSICWLVITLVPSSYYFLLFVWNGTLLFKVIILICVVLVMLVIEMMVSKSDVRYGSDFGLKKTE